MSQEKKGELNRKRRERRQQRNVHASGDHIPMEGDEHNDWLGTGNLEQYNDTKHLLGDALETIGDGMHDTCFESPIAERGVPTGQVPYREDPKDCKRRKEKERYAAMSIREIFEEVSIKTNPEDVGLSSLLNEEQRAAYDEIMSTIDSK